MYPQILTTPPNCFELRGVANETATEDAGAKIASKQGTGNNFINK